MTKIKNICKKISDVLSKVFAMGTLLSLFVGGLTFFGYLAALIIGGETAALICDFLYKTILPLCIKTSTIMVLLGLVIMYLRGEVALTSDKKKSSKHEGEM